jgi:hypothetical protein
MNEKKRDKYGTPRADPVATNFILDSLHKTMGAVG